MAALPVLLWSASSLTGESAAGGHHRVGTLNESPHCRDNEEFNSIHDGIYVVQERNVFGTCYNSEFEQSFPYARNNRIDDTFSFSDCAAFGYNVGVMPIVGLSAQFDILKLTSRSRRRSPASGFRCCERRFFCDWFA